MKRLPHSIPVLATLLLVCLLFVLTQAMLYPAAPVASLAVARPTLTLTAVSHSATRPLPPPLAQRPVTPTTSLLINEIDYDQPGTDTAEYIEIKNVSSSAIDLDPYDIHLVSGHTSPPQVYQVIHLPAVVLAPGAYFVLCADAAQVAVCDLDVTPDDNLIQNGEPDAVALMLDGQVVDVVSYEGDVGAPYREGSGMGLSDSAYSSDVGIDRFPDGVDSDRNNLDWSRRCNTPGETNSAASANCNVTVTPTQTPTPRPTNTPRPSTTPTSTPLPTSLPPTAEPSFTPSATPTPSSTPTPTWTPVPVSPTAVSLRLPYVKTRFRSSEPNGNPAEANGPIPSGEAIQGAFPSGDQRSDYFYLDLPYPYTIAASLTHIPAGQDYDLVIRDAALDVVGYSAEFGAHDEYALTPMLLPGRYYIQVYNPFYTASDQPYELRVVFIYRP